MLGHMEAEQAQSAAVQAHSLEAQAYAHAEAQAHTIAHVHSLEAQAQAHAQQVIAVVNLTQVLCRHLLCRQPFKKTLGT